MFDNMNFINQAQQQFDLHNQVHQTNNAQFEQQVLDNLRTQVEQLNEADRKNFLDLIGGVFDLPESFKNQMKDLG